MKIVSFFKEVRSEMDKIVWPTRQQTLQLTLLVAVVSLVVAAYIASLDFVYTKIMDVILK